MCSIGLCLTALCQLRSSFITPRLKKPGLDAAEACSCRPISNLSVISKMLERLFATRLLTYLDESGLIPSMQSAYCRNHSTKTVVFRVLSDILLALDCGDFAAVALRDLSVAFDTVNHDTLNRHLHVLYGLRDLALNWFCSYLQGRIQHVRFAATKSSVLTVLFSIP